MTNDFDAMEIFMKAVLDARPAQFDSTAIDVPWRIVGEAGPKLRFGVLAEDPAFPLHPVVKNALAEAVDLLKKEGHEIVALTSRDGLVCPIWDVAMQMFGLDKASLETVIKAGEPIINSIAVSRDSMRDIKWDRSLVPDTREIEDGLERFAVLNVKRAEFQEAWRKVWVDKQLDAVIGPPAQNTAVEHDQYGLAPYTCIWNFLDVCDVPSPSGPLMFEKLR